MNAHAHPDPGLSETLASLSLPEREKKRVRPWYRSASALLAGTVLVLAAVAVAPVPLRDLTRPAGIRHGDERAASETSATAASVDHAAPAAITPAPTPRLVTGSGHVVARTEAAVHPRRGGTIVEIGAEIGDRVAAGQVLLRLDDPEVGFAVRDAELALGRARLVLTARRLDADDAQRSARRMESLAGSGAVSGQAASDARMGVERAANLAEQATQELRQAELALSRSRQALAELTIVAPIAGLVTNQSARLGETILAQIDARGDATLFTIADPDRLAIDIDIAETAIDALRPGLSGEAVLDAWPDHSFAVEIERIAPAASPERGTIALRLVPSDPPAGIRPAMAVRVTLPLDGGATARAYTPSITGQ